MCRVLGKLPSGIEASPIAAAADKKGEIAVFLAKKRPPPKKTSHKRATKYPLETFATKSVYLGQMSGTFKYSFFYSISTLKTPNVRKYLQILG